MKWRTIKIFALAALLTTGIISCGGEAPQQKKTESRMEKMKPKSGDSLSKLMDRSWSNFDYVIYGFLNYDNEKIRIVADNLATLAEYMKKGITPAYKRHGAEWNEQCDLMKDLAVKLKQNVEQQNFDEAKENFQGMIGTCMDCHLLYRKHLIKTPE